MANVAMIRYIVDRLKEANSQEDKQIILQRYSNDNLFKRIIHLTYNPLIIFGMDNYTLKEDSSGIEGGMGISKFMHIPEDLYHNKLTDKEAIFACNLVLGHINVEEVEIFIGMLKKDIGVGLEIETINNVWPNLIPGYPIMNAQEITDSLVEKFQWPAVAQRLYTGKRINIICRFDLIQFRAPDGTSLTKEFEEYKNQFQTLAQNQGVVFDGSWEGDKFVLWDAVKYDGFIHAKDNRLGYNWRYNGIEHMVFLASSKNDNPCYMLPEQKIVNSLQDAYDAATEISSDIVIKNMSGIWEHGSTNDQLIIRI
jgi:hypothetical protein